MNTPLFVVLFDVERVGRQVIREVIGAAADTLYWPDVEATARVDFIPLQDLPVWFLIIRTRWNP